MKKARAIVGLILLGLAFVIVMQNTEVMTTEFFFWHVTMSRSLVLLVTFALGFLAGAIAGVLLARRTPKDRHGEP